MLHSRSKDDLIVDLQRKVDELTQYKHEFVKVCAQLQQIDVQLQQREQREQERAATERKLREQVLRGEAECGELAREKAELAEQVARMRAALQRDHEWGQRLEEQLAAATTALDAQQRTMSDTVASLRDSERDLQQRVAELLAEREGLAVEAAHAREQADQAEGKAQVRAAVAARSHRRCCLLSTPPQALKRRAAAELARSSGDLQMQLDKARAELGRAEARAHEAARERSELAARLEDAEGARARARVAVSSIDNGRWRVDARVCARHAEALQRDKSFIDKLERKFQEQAAKVAAAVGATRRRRRRRMRAGVTVAVAATRLDAQEEQSLRAVAELRARLEEAQGETAAERRRAGLLEEEVRRAPTPRPTSPTPTTPPTPPPPTPPPRETSVVPIPRV